MMIQEFAKEIRDRVENVLSGHSLKVEQIDKGNGLQMTGLIIRNGKEPFGPVIYLEPYYEQQQEGRSIEDIVEDIVSVYCENAAAPMSGSMVKDLLNWDLMKERVVYRLINEEKNRRKLAEVPNTGWLDLAVVYYLYLEEKSGQVYAAVTNGLMKSWGISQEELHRHAEKNMQELLPEVMENILDVLSCQNSPQTVEEEQPVLSVYVLTNKTRAYGASALLYGNALKRMAEKWNTDILILPSSLHEVLILPDDYGKDYKGFRSMVEEVNRDVVGPESYLSSNVYRYSRKTGEISIVVEERMERGCGHSGRKVL